MRRLRILPPSSLRRVSGCGRHPWATTTAMNDDADSVANCERLNDVVLRNWAASFDGCHVQFDAVEIAPHRVAGRGVFARRDIDAGEQLFCIPPTMTLSLDDLSETFLGGLHHDDDTQSSVVTGDGFRDEFLHIVRAEIAAVRSSEHFGVCHNKWFDCTAAAAAVASGSPIAAVSEDLRGAVIREAITRTCLTEECVRSWAVACVLAHHVSDLQRASPLAPYLFHILPSRRSSSQTASRCSADATVRYSSAVRSACASAVLQRLVADHRLRKSISPSLTAATLAWAYSCVASRAHTFQVAPREAAEQRACVRRYPNDISWQAPADQAAWSPILTPLFDSLNHGLVSMVDFADVPSTQSDHRNKKCRSIVLQASRDIRQGEEITMTYASKSSGGAPCLAASHAIEELAFYLRFGFRL